MNVCFMCDLHLPFDKNALQYDVLDWAVAEVLKSQPDCIIYAGDITCDGNQEVYDFFIDTLSKTGIKFIYIPGNSDLRCNKSKDTIKLKTSVCKNVLYGVSIFAVNDCDKTISEEQLAEIETADKNSIVFMHHPPKEHSADCYNRLLKWKESHPDTMLFYAHLHRSFNDKNWVSLQSMDPDKSIGENPCITYYNTDTRELSKIHYKTAVPKDFSEFFGISCYKALSQIDFAAQNNLKFLELRPNCVNVDINELKNAIKNWRAAGGGNLSVHLPDITWKNRKVTTEADYDNLLKIVSELKADRVTQHVPVVSVKDVNTNEQILEEICQFLADKLNAVAHDITIGVENMHMTAEDKADDTRRFGYLPEECLLLMKTLSEKCRHRVGINFDIGHARNNAPYSQKYQISTWLSMVGKYIVGYHIHQVTFEDNLFENHMPITDIYGHLISYASLFKCWETNRINKAPIIFEMRPENAYALTLKTFEKYKHCE